MADPAHFEAPVWHVGWRPLDQQPAWIEGVLLPLSWIFMFAFLVSSLLDIAISNAALTFVVILSGSAWIIAAVIVIRSRRNRSKFFNQ